MINIKEMDFNSGLPYFVVDGVKKDKIAEFLCTSLIIQQYGNQMLAPITLNSWKNGVLEIRYARTEEELLTLKKGIRNDQKLPITNSERSLLI